MFQLSYDTSATNPSESPLFILFLGSYASVLGLVSPAHPVFRSLGARTKRRSQPGTSKKWLTFRSWSGWWFQPTPLKNMSQLGFFEFPQIWKDNKCSIPPTSDLPNLKDADVQLLS